MQGEEINSKNMLKVVEVVKENLVGIIGVSNEEVKLEIERNNKKEELGIALENFIKNGKDRKYNIKVEYDEATGLVKYIDMSIPKKQ